MVRSMSSIHWPEPTRACGGIEPIAMSSWLSKWLLAKEQDLMLWRTLSISSRRNKGAEVGNPVISFNLDKFIKHGPYPQVFSKTSQVGSSKDSQQQPQAQQRGR
mmetsp:Transcript_84248/g.133531  ORF Transcript_84248/g.133531 Transcript_84248/m.133531 type:complete len:104 (-) Transcript_84248:249-560(-)